MKKRRGGKPKPLAMFALVDEGGLVVDDMSGLLCLYERRDDADREVRPDERVVRVRVVPSPARKGKVKRGR